MKHILLLDEDNLSKYNMQFLSDDFVYKMGKKLSKPVRPYVINYLPPKPDNWLFLAW